MRRSPGNQLIQLFFRFDLVLDLIEDRAFNATMLDQFGIPRAVAAEELVCLAF